MRELVRDGFAPVLDVGCAQGMLGQMLASDGTKAEIDGVEMNPAWAEMSRPFYRNVWTSTIEDAPLGEKVYRVVVCGDVLEHVVDPVAVLRRLRAAAADDAKFIVSVPNVAHLAVRLMLLFGRFPQMPKGILDRTHLHFYTKDTATDMLAAAGLKVERATVTGVPIDERWKGGEGKLVFRAMVRSQHLFLSLLPRVFGYQWIFVASVAR